MQWSRGDEKSKATRMAKSIHKLLLRVMNISIDDRSHQYKFVKNYMESGAREIRPMSYTVFDRWMSLQTNKPQFLADPEVVDCLECMIASLESKIEKMDRVLGDINAISTISDGNERGYDLMIV